MKTHVTLFLSFLFLFSCKKEIRINYVDTFENEKHPRIGYWFISPEVVEENRLIADFEYIAENSPFDLIFLSARRGCNFYDTEKMHPLFSELVKNAHARGIQIGLQLWDSDNPVTVESAQGIIVEGEITLDNSGKAKYSARQKHIRNSSINRHSMVNPLNSQLIRVYAFKKTGNGFYDKESLRDITASCKIASSDQQNINISIDGGSNMAGYTVYIMTAHYYNWNDIFGGYVSDQFRKVMKAYADIPFDGMGLDEYSYLRITPRWNMPEGESFRERFYSKAMAETFEKDYEKPLYKNLFEMRYAPENNPEIRSTAINRYMDLMRTGPLMVENDFYATAKEIFGKETFIGVHNTFHNTLKNDEMWQTGINWWTIPRDYGHTDEHSSKPVQMGVAFANPMNVLYNMYYHPEAENIIEKAFDDLRYGIRTHYHAFNDIQGWGVKLEDPVFLKNIKPVENCAVLLNKFDPKLPEVKLLTIFGIEALANWYPDETARSMYDINDKLDIEEKAKAAWDGGYWNALVSSDVIELGKLKLNADNKPEMNGHTFDAVIFMYPEYSKENTIAFLEEYVANGGKLMLEGDAFLDFSGNDISGRIEKIRESAVAKEFNVNRIADLGVAKNEIQGGCLNEDGSYTFTDLRSLQSGDLAEFKFMDGNHKISGKYAGLIVFKLDKDNQIEKLAATSFSGIYIDGIPLLELETPADIYVETTGNKINITIADSTKSIHPKTAYAE